MARPKTNGPTDYELEILSVLWAQSPLSVGELLERLNRTPKPAYTSLLTIVRSMEVKGFLKHTQEGKAFLYSPVLKKAKYKRSEIKRVADRLFGGSTVELAVNLISEEKLTTEEIEKLKKILEGL